eukprot:TRINITY_DN1423_c0_g1_i3.p1 TRINITY_DN1423_c0_g1~~TRINITY_DN1423_c0_g1_i3.p1  ORF type:complete len:376 (-),score=40.60 TRINITY_DN1423_c0_g1_i3:113-1240(-)
MEEETKTDLRLFDKARVASSYLKTNTPFLNLYHTVVAPNTGTAPKASILIFHSFFEDSSSYLTLANHLAVEGPFECYLVDFRGFGYSTGARGYVDLIELQSDVLILLQEVCCQNALRHFSLPAFILATSYAANVVTGFLINNPHLPLAGVIMCSPAFTENEYYLNLPFVEQIARTYLSPIMKIVRKSCSVDPGMLVRDKEELKTLIRSQFKECAPKYIINDYTHSILPNAGRFEYPLLLIGSEADPLSSTKELFEFFNNCKSYTQKIQVCQKSYHLLHLDYKRADILSEVVSWVNKVIVSNVNIPLLAELPKDLVVARPPHVASWGKRLLYLSALLLYLGFGYMLYSRYHQRKWFINLFIWPYHLLRFIYFREWS